MNKKESFSGIDYFRIVAALLIVAVHTFPLSIFGESADFVLTRIIARVAVPFFFVTSGFFLISKYTEDNAARLFKFVTKTAKIYALAIIIYIPINIYNNYFDMDNILPNIIKDIVFDGTLYHLWYLPASILGAVIAWFLVKKVSYYKAFAITIILYIIGLFGDSYYGVSAKIASVESFYDILFKVSDYTRNGIFFAPVFFVLGGYIADRKNRLSFKESLLGFSCCFAVMIGEALTLHHFGMQRHDSMYVFLLPSIYFLFNMLLCFNGKRHKGLRTISLVIYIIHPFMIVAIRLFAKVLHLQSLFIENSIIHFIAVSVSSIVFAVVLTAITDKIKFLKKV